LKPYFHERNQDHKRKGEHNFYKLNISIKERNKRIEKEEEIMKPEEKFCLSFKEIPGYYSKV